MKTKQIIFICILLLAALPGYNQVFTRLIEIKTGNKPQTMPGNTTEYRLLLINMTGSSVFIITGDEILLKVQDTLEMKYNPKDKKLIMPKIGKPCATLQVQWRFENKAEKFDLCLIDTTKSVTIDQPAVEPGRDSGISFLPPPGFEDWILNSMKINQPPANPTMVKYRFICNVSGGEIRYEDLFSGNARLKRIRPRIGKDVQVVIENYNPYTDSVGLSYDFINNNQEEGERFASLMSGFKQNGQPAQPAEKSIGAEGQGTGLDTEVLAAFARDMESFYLEKLARPFIDPIVLAACIDEINIRIRTNFKINDNTPEAISAKIAPLIATFGSGAVADNYNKMLNTGLYYYQKIISYKTTTLLPIQVINADDMVLNFTVFKNNRKVDSRTYTYYNLGGFKMDFSTGLFGTTLVDYNYTTKVVQCVDTVFYKKNFVATDSIMGLDTTNKNQIIRDNLGNYTVGIGLLAHFYFRTNPWVNLAINTGFMIDNTIATKFLFGVSLLLGHDTRFNLNAGGVIGQVKRLASGLSEGQYYTADAGQVQTIPSKDVWKCGWYVGISYNFKSVSPKKKSAE